MTLRSSGIGRAVAAFAIAAFGAWTSPAVAAPPGTTYGHAGPAFVGGTGGSVFRIDCPAGQFVNGLSLKQYYVLDGLDVRCAALDTTTGAVRPGTNPNIPVGGPGGYPKELSCGSQGLVDNLEVTARYLDTDRSSGILAFREFTSYDLFVAADIVLGCVDPASGNRWSVRTGWGKDGEYLSSYVTDSMACNEGPGRPLVLGIFGGAGTFVDRVGIVCGSAEIGPQAPPAPPRPPIRRVTPMVDCETYAAAAVAASTRARGAACGFGGARYDASHAEHLAWCRQTSQGAVKAEQDAREAEVAACIANRPNFGDLGGGVDIARVARCQQYADRAEAANKQVADYQCGLGADGGRHLASRQDHYTFCLNNAEERVASEEARRQADLEACAICRSYSRTAVEQIAASKSCTEPPGGDLWLPEDEEPHFQACFINRPGEAPFVNPGVQGYQDVRAGVLATCR